MALNHDDPQEYLNPPASRRLASITCPTLIILGERDEPDFHAIAAACQRDIPESELITIPDVGHMVNMEAAEIFNDVALRFLEEHWT